MVDSLRQRVGSFRMAAAGMGAGCLRSALVGVFIALAVGCTRHQDRFWPDTDTGTIALTDPRVAAGDADLIAVQRPVDDPGGFATVLRLSRTLRVGDRVTVRVSVAIDGEYEIGGGWIFRGQKRTGLYGVAGDILSVASSDPDVLGVAVDDFSNLTIEAVSPGRSTLTLEATMSRRYSSRPDTAAVEVGAVTFTVIAAAADG